MSIYCDINMLGVVVQGKSLRGTQGVSKHFSDFLNKYYFQDNKTEF
jgi:hypothetical protein